MNLGRIEQIGTPTDLYESPKNKFVADFIGDTNLIMDVEITSENSDRLELMTSTGLPLSIMNNSNFVPNHCHVVIRPERIRFLTSAVKSTHAYAGVVEEKIYLGNTIKYKILVEGKESLVLTENNDQRASNHSNGETVQIGWDDLEHQPDLTFSSKKKGGENATWYSACSNWIFAAGKHRQTRRTAEKMSHRKPLSLFKSR